MVKYLETLAVPNTLNKNMNTGTSPINFSLEGLILTAIIATALTISMLFKKLYDVCELNDYFSKNNDMQSKY